MRTVPGSELANLGKRLKVAGEVGIRREMIAGLRAAAKPVIPKMRDAARADLPKRGGLNEIVAAQKIGTSVRLSANKAGVSVRAQFTRTNRGHWRHPVFGVWRPNVPDQVYEPAKGWFDDTAEAEKPAAMVKVEAVLAKVDAQVQRLGL